MAPKIHSNLLIKNESDIIVQTLTAAARWSDFIYVYDTGSTDGTWEKVLELSHKLPQIIPFKQEDRPFFEILRREPFNHYREQSSPGDWWCRLDADEIYIDSPKEFLACVPKSYDAVWSAIFQYYFTEKDVARFNQNPELYGDDVPVEQKCKYYINNWAEIKFFKYGTHLKWNSESGKQPYPLTRSYPRMIRMKHYQFRSPQQIEMRFATRRAAMDRELFVHETLRNWSQSILQGAKQNGEIDGRFPASWTERVVDSSKLIYDTGTNYVMTEELMPRIIDSNPSFMRKVKNRLNRALHSMSRVRA